jgi:hypothetical protein
MGREHGSLGIAFGQTERSMIWILVIVIMLLFFGLLKDADKIKALRNEVETLQERVEELEDQLGDDVETDNDPLDIFI